MVVFPEEDGPKSFERSIVMVSIVPSRLISTFFILGAPTVTVSGSPTLVFE